MWQTGAARRWYTAAMPKKMGGLLCVVAFCGACAGGNVPDEAEEAVSTTPPVALSSVYDRVRQELYPELADLTIVYAELQSDTDFFTSDVVKTTIFNSGRHRTYRLNYNPKLFADPPADDALYAILAHELKHTKDYAGMSSFALAAFAAQYVLGDPSAYEHQTDEYALELGLSRGLEAYRIWLYAHVAPSGLAAKEKQYYTPAEIDAWVAAHPEFPQR
jgi:hypothetical protein